MVVMYLGKAVENADVRALFTKRPTRTPRRCSNSIPKIGRKVKSKLKPVTGMVPNPYNRPKGYMFHPRCPYAIPGTCDELDPPLIELSPEHRVSCWLYTEKKEA